MAKCTQKVGSTAPNMGAILDKRPNVGGAVLDKMQPSHLDS